MSRSAPEWATVAIDEGGIYKAPQLAPGALRIRNAPVPPRLLATSFSPAPSLLLYVLYMTTVSGVSHDKQCTVNHILSTGPYSDVPKHEPANRDSLNLFNFKPVRIGLFLCLDTLCLLTLSVPALTTTQTMPLGDPQVVPRGGRFIGSSAGAFLDQMAADIYLQNIWTTQGRVRRVGVACVGWGLSVGMIQEADSPEPGRPGIWSHNNALRDLLRVDDEGPQNGGVQPGVALPNDTAPGEDIFVVNEQAVRGPKLPWHHRLTLRVRVPDEAEEVEGDEEDGEDEQDVEDGQDGECEPDEEGGEHVQLHYHKHAPRKGHGPKPPKILPKVKGKHYIFDEVIFSTQIQNCRRAKPKDEPQEN